MGARAYRRAYADAYETGRLFTLHVSVMRGEPKIIIHAFDSNVTDPRTGHQRIYVEVQQAEALENGRQRPRVVFPLGQLHCAVNQWTALDGNEARELVMSLVAMRPGDTDDEYFATNSYTPEQLAWAEKYGEAIDCERADRYCCHECGAVRPCHWHGGKGARS